MGDLIARRADEVSVRFESRPEEWVARTSAGPLPTGAFAALSALSPCGETLLGSVLENRVHVVRVSLDGCSTFAGCSLSIEPGALGSRGDRDG